MAQATLIIRDNDEDGFNVKVRFDPDFLPDDVEGATQAQKMMLAIVGAMKDLIDSAGGTIEPVDVS